MKETYLTPAINVELIEKDDVLLISGIIDNRNIYGSGLDSFLDPEAEDNKNILGGDLSNFM